MNITTKEIASAILTHTWQLTLLLLLVWGLARLVKRRPQISYIVCLVIVLKCILPPFWASPTSVFSWLMMETPTQTAGTTPSTSTKSDGDRYVFQPMPVNTVIDEEPVIPIETVGVVGEMRVIPQEKSTSIQQSNAPPTPEHATPRANVGGILVIVWLAGACLFLLLWFAQIVRFRRRLQRSARLCTNPEVIACVDRLRTQLGVRRRVRVLEADEHFQACSFGIWQPTILLPGWLLRDFPAVRREQVIAHEMIHIRRGDLFHALLQGFAQAVWWFHPLVWWFNRLMIDLRERCCDRELLARLACSPIGYAECLLQVLKGHRAHHSLEIGLAPHPTMAGSRRFEHTRERIEEIMTEQPQTFRRIRLHHWIIAGLLAAAVLPGAALVVPSHADALAVAEKAAPPAPEKLQPVADGMVVIDDIDSPSSVDVSSDGKFVYMASWSSGTLNVFSRDAASGKLNLIQTLTAGNENEPLQGAVHIHLSPNNQYAAVSCLHARSFLLYARDAKTGKLSVLDVIRGDQTKFNDKPVLYWTSDAVWSPDGKFIYVADAHAPGLNDGDYVGSIVVLQLVNKKLKIVDVFEGNDRCFANARGMAVHPDGVTVFAVSSTAGTLVVMDRDAAKGKLSIRQIVDSEAVQGLRGVMQVDCSADGQYIYTASGRFKDGNAVCVFKLGSDGKVKPIQTLSNAGGQLPKFEGGNKIRVSPDGNTVYATGTSSNHAVVLQRDPKTGKLSLTQMIDTSELPGSPKGPNGLAFSPDGKHLYVTWESSKGVSVFDRLGQLGHAKEPVTKLDPIEPKELGKSAEGKSSPSDRVSKIDERVMSIERQIQVLSQKHGEDHPEVRKLQSQYHTLTQNIETEMVTLRHHRADVVAKLLEVSKIPFDKIGVDTVTNSLIIRGPVRSIARMRDEIDRFEALAEELLIRGGDEKAKLAAIEKEKRALAETSQLRLLELDIAEAKLSVDFAEKELKRLQQLPTVVPASEIEMKQLALDRSKIALKRAELKLEQAKLELR